MTKCYDLKTDYTELQVTLLKMWCDDILTDAEYHRISDRVYEMKKKEEKDNADAL